MKIFRFVFVLPLVFAVLVLVSGDVFGATPIYVRTDGDDVICSGEVDAAVGAFVGTGQPCSALTINQGIALVDAGGTVNVAAGTYTDNVTIDKKLELVGAGDGDNPVSDTIIDPSSGLAVWTNSGIFLAVGGDSESDRLVIRNLRLNDAYHGLCTNSAVSFITVQDVTSTGNVGNGIEIHNSADITDLQLIRVDLTSNGNGMKLAGQIDGLTVTDGSVDGNNYGYYVNGGDIFTNINITGTSFSNNVHRAMYLQSLDNAVFRNITVTGNGNTSTEGYGIDLNLNSGAFQNIQIIDSQIYDNGKGNTKNGGEGAGIMISARDSYSATLDNLVISGTEISDNQRGVLIGELTETINGPTNVSFVYCNIQNNQIEDVTSTVNNFADAVNDYWGSAAGPAGAVITGNVNTGAWCTNSTCASSISALASTSHPNTLSWYNDADPDWSWTVDDGSNTGTAIPFTTYYIADQVSSHAATDGTWLSTTSASFNAYSAAGLADGDWYFHVLVENDAGRSTAVETAGPAKIDTTAPAAGSVSDGTGADIDYTVTADTLSAGWTGFSDAGSGISKYWYAIGTASDGSDTGTSGGWVDNGAGTSVTAAGLTLTAGQVYYFAVKAEDAGGLQSAAAVSDGQVAGAAGTCGDADGDGSVMSSDVLMVKRVIDGALSLDAQQVARADVQVAGSSPDGAVDATDLDIIARTAIGENGLTPAGLTCNANP